MKVLVSRFESVFKKALQAHVDAAVGNTEGYQYVNAIKYENKVLVKFTNALTQIHFNLVIEATTPYVHHAWVDTFKVEGEANDIATVSTALMTLKHIIIQSIEAVRNGEYQ